MQLTPEQGALLVEIMAEHHRRVAKMVDKDALKKIHELSRAISDEFEAKTYTVICREDDQGYPDPLIFVVGIAGKLEHDKVLEEVRKQRTEDLDGDGVTAEELNGWLDKLRICFAFEGDLPVSADWRD